MGNEISQLAKQGGITFVGNLFGRLLGFVYVAVITRLVSPSVYGTFTLALSIVLFIRGISDLSLYRALDYFLPQYLEDGEEAKADGTLKTVILLSLISTTLVATLLIVASQPVALLFSDPRLLTVLPVLAVIIPLETLSKSIESIFKSVKILKYRSYMKDILNPMFRLIITTVLILAGAELFGLVIGHIFALVIAIVSGLFFFYRESNWFRQGSIGSVRKRQIVSYSLPLVFAGVIYSIVGYIDQFLIGYFLDSSDVAYYQVAFILAANTLIILKSLTPIYKPTVASAQDDPDQLSIIYKTTTQWVTMFTLPIIITLLIAPQLYLSTFFSAEYTVATSAFLALLVGYLFNSSFGPEGMMLEGLGHTRLTLLNTGILIIVNGVLNVILIPRMGIVGAGIATGTGLTVAGLAGVIEIYYLRKVHPYSIHWLKLWIAISPAVIIGLIILRSSIPPILLACILPPIITIVYLISLISVSGFTDKDYEVAKKIDEKLGTSLFEKIVSYGL